KDSHAQISRERHKIAQRKTCDTGLLIISLDVLFLGMEFVNFQELTSFWLIDEFFYPPQNMLRRVRKLTVFQIIKDSVLSFGQNDSMTFAASTAFYTIFSMPALLIIIL